VFGSIDSYDSVARQLAVATDSLVVSVGYRQPPLHPFPVPLQDCIAAVKWVKRSIANYNGACSACYCHTCTLHCTTCVLVHRSLCAFSIACMFARVCVQGLKY
jgi:alpha/beta hydrolase fold